MDKAAIEGKMREIISKRVKGLTPEAIGMDTELAALGVDSLAYNWILADVEEAFGLALRGADALKLQTLSAAVNYLHQNARA